MSGARPARAGFALAGVVLLLALTALLVVATIEGASRAVTAASIAVADVELQAAADGALAEAEGGAGEGSGATLRALAVGAVARLTTTDRAGGLRTVVRVTRLAADRWWLVVEATRPAVGSTDVGLAPRRRIGVLLVAPAPDVAPRRLARRGWVELL